MKKDNAAAANEGKAAALAEEVLDMTRNRLLVSLRFLDVALNMQSRKIYGGSIAADGSSIYYSPLYILRTYRDSPEELTREYLHVVLHSVFMHPYLGGRQDRQKWDLACDIAVEAAINDLGLACVRSSRGERQTAVLKKMKREIRPLTAVRIYRELVSGNISQNISQKKTDELISIFSPDDHSV
jgi:predicted metal-dependent peptidase